MHKINVRDIPAQELQRLRDEGKKREQSLRKMLNEIDTYLCGTYGADLWVILNALRGPDFNDAYDVKEATTSVIRSTAFPQVAKSLLIQRNICAVYEQDCEEFVIRRKALSSSGTDSHFWHHVTAAFTRLGLKWNNLNPPTQPTPQPEECAPCTD